MSEYGFFSNQGELSARRLITGICRDIESDLVTRKFALDRLSSGLEKISEKDDGVFERDVFEAIASQLSQSFSMMRYNIITSSELRDHFNLWCKKDILKRYL